MRLGEESPKSRGSLWFIFGWLPFLKAGKGRIFKKWHWMALGPSTHIMGELQVNIHTWLYFKNDFYMLVAECGMLLSSSFL